MGNICGSAPSRSSTLPVLTNSSNYQHFTTTLKDLVRTQFVENPSICFIDSESETVEVDGIPFQYRLIKSLAKKPTLAGNNKGPMKDPFMPPFEPGLFITELSDTHNLLFNKFCICKEHTLVTTKKMERQDSPLTNADF